MEGMKAQGIQTSMHYPPIHTFTAYMGLANKSSLPITEEVARREVTLPLYPALSDSEVMEVVQAVRKAL